MGMNGTHRSSTPSAVEVRHRSAEEAGFGAVSDRYEVTGAGGLQASGQDCAQASATLASCDARAVADPAATGSAGDRDGTRSPGGRGTTSSTGDRADGLIGFAGNDRLYGGSGRDALFAQKGRDRMFGGPQNDVLLARDGFKDPVISCGKGGRQTATTDSLDPKPRGCTSPKQSKGQEAKGKKRVRAARPLASPAAALAQGL